MAGALVGARAGAEVSKEASSRAAVGVVDMGEASVGVELTPPGEAGMVRLMDPTMVAHMPWAAKMRSTCLKMRLT